MCETRTKKNGSRLSMDTGRIRQDPRPLSYIRSQPSLLADFSRISVLNGNEENDENDEDGLIWIPLSDSPFPSPVSRGSGPLSLPQLPFVASSSGAQELRQHVRRPWLAVLAVSF